MRRKQFVADVLGPVNEYVRADRSMYSRVKPYPIVDHRQIHLPKLRVKNTALMLQQSLEAHGLERTESHNYFELEGWRRGESVHIALYDARLLGSTGTIIAVSHTISVIEAIVVRMTHSHLPTDPLGQGTITSFFDRSYHIPCFEIGTRNGRTIPLSFKSWLNPEG